MGQSIKLGVTIQLRVFVRPLEVAVHLTMNGSSAVVQWPTSLLGVDFGCLCAGCGVNVLNRIEGAYPHTPPSSQGHTKTARCLCGSVIGFSLKPRMEAEFW